MFSSQDGNAHWKKGWAHIETTPLGVRMERVFDESVKARGERLPAAGVGDEEHEEERVLRFVIDANGLSHGIRASSGGRLLQ